MSQPVSAGVPSQRRARNGLGVAALVIGVLALVLAVLFIFAPLGAILGLIAVGLGIGGLVRANSGVASNRGQAVAGLITGAFGLVIAIVFMVTIGTFLARHSLDFRTFGRCMDQAVGVEAHDSCVRQLTDKLDR
jgi:hypothetical protein